MDSEGTVQLLANMNRWAEEEMHFLSRLKHCGETFKLLLQATLEDLNQ
jgi:hypothetical protein